MFFDPGHAIVHGILLEVYRKVQIILSLLFGLEG